MVPPWMLPMEPEPATKLPPSGIVGLAAWAGKAINKEAKGLIKIVLKRSRLPKIFFG